MLCLQVETLLEYYEDRRNASRAIWLPLLTSTGLLAEVYINATYMNMSMLE